jgi:hypothetical protein
MLFAMMLGAYRGHKFKGRIIEVRLHLYDGCINQ